MRMYKCETGHSPRMPHKRVKNLTAASLDNFELLRRVRLFTLLAIAVSLLFLVVRAGAQAVGAPNDSTTTSATPNGAAQSQASQAGQRNAGQPDIPAPDSQNNQNAQSAQPASSNVRAVRLSDVEGTVQILRGGTVQFSQAVMNMPILQGAQIKTGPDGRAEIEFEDGSVTRITPNSSLNITKLEAAPDGTLSTTLEQLSGLIYYELRDDPETPYKVMLANRTIAPTANTTFRVALGNPPSVAVIDGSVRVHGASNYVAEVPQGETITFTPSSAARYTLSSGIIPNGFDQWNDQRDQEAAQEAQKQTPARKQQQGGGGAPMGSLIGYGWGSLDAYGGWYPMPGYGMVWQPGGMGAGFDPYGNGMWANMGMDMGYSWVSGYPWGWLPFHYGMWSYIGGFGWGWMPGMGMGMMGYGGMGYGGFGGGGYGYGYGGFAPYARAYGGPAGYRPPVRPGANGAARGQQGPAFIPGRTGAVGGTMRAVSMTAGGRGGFTPQPINFNGTKIAPLHSMLSGVNVPIRNAALYNNHPANAFPGGIRNALLSRNSGIARGGMGTRQGVGGMRQGAAGRSGGNAGIGRGFSNGALGGSYNVARNNSANRPFGTGHAFGAANRGAFGQHSSFGSHGSFGGAHSAFHSGGSFRSGGMGGMHASGGTGGGGMHGGGFGGGHGGGGGGHGGGGGGGGHGH